ncbi:hypothetical protein [Streptomyces sp. NPDC006739]|uniref:hypothetical protein n=1 Tax=Streptomyces sp. NPDC006739 TaxID=3364763 RepID=UPI0036C9D310
MRKFQRAAVVAAVVAGLSALGVGVSFAGGQEDDAPPQLTAVANSQANAVATWGGYYNQPRYTPEAPVAAPEAPKEQAPEQGYGQYGGQEDSK